MEGSCEAALYFYYIRMDYFTVFCNFVPFCYTKVLFISSI